MPWMIALLRMFKAENPIKLFVSPERLGWFVDELPN